MPTPAVSEPSSISEAIMTEAKKQEGSTRRLISSGSVFEARIGYSRAVRDGDWIFVSGTAGFDYDTSAISDDAAMQRCRQSRYSRRWNVCWAKLAPDGRFGTCAHLGFGTALLGACDRNRQQVFAGRSTRCHRLGERDGRSADESRDRSDGASPIGGLTLMRKTGEVRWLRP